MAYEKTRILIGPAYSLKGLDCSELNLYCLMTYCMEQLA